MHRVATYPPYALLALALSIGLGGALAPSGALAADRLAPGQYQIVATKTGSPPTTFQQCVDSERAKAVSGSVIAGRAAAQKDAEELGCVLKSYELTGDTITQAMVCGGATATSRATYRGDSFEDDQAATGASTHWVAKRIGPCK